MRTWATPQAKIKTPISSLECSLWYAHPGTDQSPHARQTRPIKEAQADPTGHKAQDTLEDRTTPTTARLGYAKACTPAHGPAPPSYASSVTIEGKRRNSWGHPSNATRIALDHRTTTHTPHPSRIPERCQGGKACLRSATPPTLRPFRYPFRGRPRCGRTAARILTTSEKSKNPLRFAKTSPQRQHSSTFPQRQGCTSEMGGPSTSEVVSGAAESANAIVLGFVDRQADSELCIPYRDAVNVVLRDWLVGQRYLALPGDPDTNRSRSGSGGRAEGLIVRWARLGSSRSTTPHAGNYCDASGRLAKAVPYAVGQAEAVSCHWRDLQAPVFWLLVTEKTMSTTRR